jgi:hypothetical protein
VETEPCTHCHDREHTGRCDCSPNMWYRIWWHPVSTVWHNLSPSKTHPVHAYECTSRLIDTTLYQWKCIRTRWRCYIYCSYDVSSPYSNVYSLGCPPHIL